MLTVIGIRLLPEPRRAAARDGAAFGLSGVQMLALAIVGEHVRSALAGGEATPQFVIEAATSDDVLAMTVK